MSIITTCPAHGAQCTTAARTQGYLWDLLTKLEPESLKIQAHDPCPEILWVSLVYSDTPHSPWVYEWT